MATTSVSDKLSHAFVTHDVNLQRFQAHQRQVILSSLKALESRIVKKVQAHAGEETFTQARQKVLLKQVRESIVTAYKDIYSEHKTSLLDLATLESVHVQQMVNAQVGFTAMSVGASESLLASLVKDDTVLGAPLRAMWEQEAGAIHQAFIAQMRQGIIAGETTDQLVQRVRGTKALNYKDGIMDVRRRGAEMRVRTSAQSILNDVRLSVYKANEDVLKGWQVLAVLDDRTSDICIARSGMAWDLEGDPLTDETDEDFPGPPPWHPNAVLNGSTFMSYGRLDEMVRADYEGPAILVKTAQGQHTTIGPNHPILTSRGMVRACDLHEGDQLVHDRRFDPSVPVEQANFKQVPLVEDCFESLCAEGLSARRTIPRHDFHGDGIFCQGEVDVIEPQHSLLLVGDSCGVEQYRKCGFVRSNVESVKLPGDCPRDLSVHTVDLTSPCGMGGSLSRHFQFLHVQSIHYVKYRGKAFDATTETGIYNSDGFVVSNCRSTLIPIVKSIGEILDDDELDARVRDAAEDLPEKTQASMDGQVAASLTYEDWLRTKDEAFQIDVLGPGKYELWKKGQIGLKDLIDQRGNPLTLEQLKARN